MNRHHPEYFTTTDTTDDTRMNSKLNNSPTGRKVQSCQSSLDSHNKRHSGCSWKGWRQRDVLTSKLVESQREHYRHLRTMVCQKFNVSLREVTSLVTLPPSTRVDGSHNPQQHIDSLMTLLLG